MGNIKSMVDQQIIEKIEELISQVRPHIQQDGGDIEFVSFNQGTVSLRLHGACVTCPVSFYTLKLGVEERLKEHIPEVHQVVTVD
jgi:Fe-S cluster biogenesis protein NfuA